jgi:hypothetical protein
VPPREAVAIARRKTPETRRWLLSRAHSKDPRPESRAGHHAPIRGLLEERLEATPLSPEQLQGRASELRAEAEQAQTGGDKDAKVALADHYEETAAKQLARR